MTFQRSDKPRRRSARSSAATVPPDTPLAQELSDPLPEDQTVLALAAIACGGAIEGLAYTAGQAGFSLPGVPLRGRQGRSARRAAILDIVR